MEISTVSPAYAERAMLHSCQPAELPLAAFQAPVVPVPVQLSTPFHVW